MATAFITEVKESKHPQLSLVGKEHQKLQSVIGAFGNKIENMVDKQRGEYTQAYSHHMREVQKELYELREKATAIANDKTRDEKIKKLDADQKMLRNDALQLDAYTNELRKKLRALTTTITSVERERDWLLIKLRDAKLKYTELQNECGVQAEDANSYSMLSSQEDNSLYTLDMKQRASNLTRTVDDQYQQAKGSNRLPAIEPFADPQQQFNAMPGSIEGAQYGVSRDFALMSALPQMLPALHQPGQGQSPAYYKSTSAHTKQEKEKTKPKMTPVVRPAGRHRFNSKTPQTTKKAVGNLVAARTRQEAIRDFLGLCANTCDKGAFSKLRKPSSLEALLEDCVANCALTDRYEAANLDEYQGGENESSQSQLANQRYQLACALAGIPEVYFCLNDLMCGDGEEALYDMQQ